jgi:hypothetical protein
MTVSFATVGRDVVNYSIVLLLTVDDDVETIRLYDGAHGQRAASLWPRWAETVRIEEWER